MNCENNLNAAIQGAALGNSVGYDSEAVCLVTRREPTVLEYLTERRAKRIRKLAGLQDKIEKLPKEDSHLTVPQYEAKYSLYAPF